MWDRRTLLWIFPTLVSFASGAAPPAAPVKTKYYGEGVDMVQETGLFYYPAVLRPRARPVEVWSGKRAFVSLVGVLTALAVTFLLILCIQHLFNSSVNPGRRLAEEKCGTVSTTSDLLSRSLKRYTWSYCSKCVGRQTPSKQGSHLRIDSCFACFEFIRQQCHVPDLMLEHLGRGASCTIDWR